MIKVQAIVDKEKAIVNTSEMDFAAKRIVEVELSQTTQTIPVYNEKTKRHYEQAILLARLHTFPLGLVELPFEEKDLTPQRYLPIIWERLSQQINEHLQQDGLAPISELNEKSFVAEEQPRCLQERQQFLEQAPFISIIVPTKDRPQQIDSCLQKLLLLNYPNYEVIVVDNAPGTSATFDLIHHISLSNPRVHYIREDRPGPSWARNCGITIAKGELLAFVDDDVVVDTYWLVELVRAFSLADKVACVTGLVLPLELETPAQLLFEEHGGFGRGFTQRIFDLSEHRPKERLFPYSAGRFGTGASMAFTAEFLRSAGGFDPTIGGNGPARCGQDIALFFRSVARGYRLVYTPMSLSYHLHRRDYAGLQKQIYNYGVGLTAYLTKSLLENPHMILDFLINVPYGLFFALNSQSPKNKKKQAHYPKDLTRMERKGMIYGPLAYFRSRHAMQKLRKATTAYGASPSQLEPMEI